MTEFVRNDLLLTLFFNEYNIFFDLFISFCLFLKTSTNVQVIHVYTQGYAMTILIDIRVPVHLGIQELIVKRVRL